MVMASGTHHSLSLSKYIDSKCEVCKILQKAAFSVTKHFFRDHIDDFDDDNDGVIDIEDDDDGDGIKDREVRIQK